MLTKNLLDNIINWFRVEYEQANVLAISHDNNRVCTMIEVSHMSCLNSFNLFYFLPNISIGNQSFTIKLHMKHGLIKFLMMLSHNLFLNT